MSRLNVLAFFHPGLACTAIGILIAAAPAALAQDSEREKHYQQYLHDHTDASGAVRPDLLQKGAEYVKHMKITAGIPVKKGGGPGAASVDKIGPKIASPGSITGVQWTGVGPASMPVDSNQPVMGSGPVSGEVVDIAIDQRGTADQVIYIATNDGGIWKTSDGGNSWATTMDSMPSLSMGAVALDPNNPSIVYAGTGDPFDGSGRYCCNGAPNLKAVGIYKSIDAGNTWQHFNQLANVGFTGIFTGVAINRIVVLPSNSNVVLVASASGLFRSADGGQNFGSNAPNFNDGLAIVAPGTFISDLKVDTSNGSVLAAVSGVGILQSVDGGVTFPTNVFPGTGSGKATLTDPISNVTFAQSTLPNNKTIYAFVSSATTVSPTSGNLIMEGLYKSIDYGTTWTQILPYNWPAIDPRTPGAQLAYDQSVGVDPQNPNLIYFGIVGMWGATDGGAGGPTSFNGVGDSQIHNDHHAMAFSPRNHWSGPTTAIFDGSDGGVSTSGDGGATWTDIDNGLATGLFFSMSMGLGSSGNSNQYMYGALQDLGNPTHRPTMGATVWHLNTGGDGFAVAADACSRCRGTGEPRSNVECSSESPPLCVERLAGKLGRPHALGVSRFAYHELFLWPVHRSNAGLLEGALDELAALCVERR